MLKPTTGNIVFKHTIDSEKRRTTTMNFCLLFFQRRRKNYNPTPRFFFQTDLENKRKGKVLV
jgi:hypothetical protein